MLTKTVGYKGVIINYLEKPFEEYTRHFAEIFVGTKSVKKTKMKCLLWFPKDIGEEPHFYLLIEDYKEYKYFQQLLKKHLNTINIKINITTLEGTPYQCHIIKKASFSNSQMTIIAEDWYEAFVKYNFPKYALTQTTQDELQESKFCFFISESKLLSSNVSTIKHFTGEVQRSINSSIQIREEVLHLGIESIITDKYIGLKSSNILEIIPNSPINSLMAFYKNIQPIADLILVLTSFAERRRLNWYKCEGSIGTNYIENYHTRISFYKDERTVRLISKPAFERFLKNSLQNIELKNIKYITKLLLSYLSGIDYSVNAKIILWNSILEKVLKNNFQKKKDALKEELIKQMNIFVFDLSPIQDLIDIRNTIAHGDDVKTDKLFQLSDEWQILIERVLLRELKWDSLSKTDVHLDEIKPYGL
ncbi:hypothetical protein [Sulfurimonas sp. NWX367]|uniref:hypothetical protein n=1 Tax=unclassified Sulfurimonas TaxID=2623549 RepID=UPI00320472D7